MIRGVDFVAGGKPYCLRYTTNRLCSLEASSGKAMMDWVSVFGDGRVPSFIDLRTLFHAGLWPSATVEEAGELMDELGAETVGALIGKGFEAAFEVSAQGGAAENPRIAAAG